VRHSHADLPWVCCFSAVPGADFWRLMSRAVARFLVIALPHAPWGWPRPDLDYGRYGPRGPSSAILFRARVKLCNALRDVSVSRSNRLGSVDKRTPRADRSLVTPPGLPNDNRSVRFLLRPSRPTSDTRIAASIRQNLPPSNWNPAGTVFDELPIHPRLRRVGQGSQVNNVAVRRGIDSYASSV